MNDLLETLDSSADMLREDGWHYTADKIEEAIAVIKSQGQIIRELKEENARLKERVTQLAGAIDLVTWGMMGIEPPTL
jgi:hypothetical protein